MTVDSTECRWFKSSYSGTGSQCVEVAFVAAGWVGVRDSKNPTGPALMFSSGEWDAFTAGVFGGALDGSE
ncbi:DUF397 domain-containing protein [Nocardia tengchongensis]